MYRSKQHLLGVLLPGFKHADKKARARLQAVGELYNSFNSHASRILARWFAGYLPDFFRQLALHLLLHSVVASRLLISFKLVTVTNSQILVIKLTVG